MASEPPPPYTARALPPAGNPFATGRRPADGSWHGPISTAAAPAIAAPAGRRAADGSWGPGPIDPAGSTDWHAQSGEALPAREGVTAVGGDSLTAGGGGATRGPSRPPPPAGRRAPDGSWGSGPIDPTGSTGWHAQSGEALPGSTPIGAQASEQQRAAAASLRQPQHHAGVGTCRCPSRRLGVLPQRGPGAAACLPLKWVRCRVVQQAKGLCLCFSRTCTRRSCVTLCFLRRLPGHLGQGQGQGQGLARS